MADQRVKQFALCFICFLLVLRLGDSIPAKEIGSRLARFLYTSVTTTITQFTSTSTNTVTLTTTCFVSTAISVTSVAGPPATAATLLCSTNVVTACPLTATITAGKKKRAISTEEISMVEVDGERVRWKDFIKPVKSSDAIELGFMPFTVNANATSAIGKLGQFDHNYIEETGLAGQYRQTRGGFYPITYLSKTTTELVFGTVTTTNLTSSKVSVTFLCCTPVGITNTYPAC